MDRRKFVKNITYGGLTLGVSGIVPVSLGRNLAAEELKIGIVGLSVHCAAF